MKVTEVIKKMWLVGLLSVGVIAQSGPAYADPIGPFCSKCQGSIYTLSYSGFALPDSDPFHETFGITLTIDTSGYWGAGVAIDSVAIKVSPSVFSSSLVDAPGGVGNWQLVPGGINSRGCSGKGGGFDCADWIASGPGAPVGGILAWTFDQTIDIDSLITSSLGDSIKARYVDANGRKIGALMSKRITLQSQVPEPSTLLLLGSGLAGLGLWGRKRMRR